MRKTCVSTAIAGFPNHNDNTTLAVLRPTPGKRTKSSMVEGTLPSNSSRIMFARP
jgi:hypothetical protein